MSDLKKISALIICRNEEKNIEDCLKSVLWCDEIVVIDAFSTDRTIEIAEKFTENIFQNEWKGFAEQRKFALTKADSEWILSIDADERITKELESEIRLILSADNIDEDGFEIPRKSFFLSNWIKHGGWYPNYQLRLFKKNKAEVTERLVHESYTVSGKTKRLKEDILHFTVTSLTDFVNKINAYSDLSALEKSGREKIGFIEILIYPGIAFFSQYILKGNFLDGIAGLMVSKFHMITKLLNYMKIRELQTKEKVK